MSKPLTPKQEKFCQCIADGISQADAYRAAFDAGKMKDSTIYVRASELMADSKISGRVSELRAKLESKALWTRQMSVQTLIEAIELAKSNEDAKSITGAVKELNAMHGYNAPTEINAKLGGSLEVVRRVIIDPRNDGY